MFWIYAPTPGDLTGPYEVLGDAAKRANEIAWEEDLDVYVVEVDSDQVVIEAYYTNMNGDIVGEDRYNGDKLSSLN